MRGVTPAQLRKIHTLAREHGVDEDLLHEYVCSLVGKDSLRKLTIQDAVKVIDGLAGRQASRKDPASSRQIWYIRVLMKELGWVDEAGEPDMARLDGLCQKYARIDSYRWLDKRSASNLIEALKNMKEKMLC